MNRHFLDSSARAKRYRLETGTDVVDRIVDDAGNVCLVSRLGLTELCSLFALRIRLRELTECDFDIVCDLIRNDLRNGRLRLIPVRASHYDQADDLLVTEGFHRGLRSLDAIQLAIALEAHRETALTFVTSDKKLLGVAASCGLTTFDPEKP